MSGVEYVLLHELCHLAEHNHSPRFHALLDRHMPGWREVKDELDGLSDAARRLNSPGVAFHADARHMGSGLEPM